jgi:hypothetical protein
MVIDKVKKMTDEEVKEYREELRRKLFETEEDMKYIDRELIKRKPFVTMADKQKMNDARYSDITMCSFWDCSEKARYRIIVSIKGEVFTLSGCEEHTRIAYDTRYSVIYTAFLDEGE